ncbi:MAG TPA: hypothetical protein VF403_23765 [Kofleriaceae bacterium]
MAKNVKKKAPAKAKKAPAKVGDSYAPFTIDELGDTVRLSFFDCDWLEKQHGSIEIDGYYMNGPGVEGLVQAVMFANKIESDDVEGDSEGDACLLNFTDVKLATRVAQLAAAMIKDRTQLAKTIKVAREEGFED